MADKFLCSHSDVFGYLPQKHRRNVATRVKWDRRSATVSMPELAMRTALSHFDEAESFQNSNDIARLEDWNVAHAPVATDCVPTNSASSFGSPSSNSISITSRKFRFNSSSV